MTTTPSKRPYLRAVALFTCIAFMATQLAFAAPNSHLRQIRTRAVRAQNETLESLIESLIKGYSHHEEIIDAHLLKAAHEKDQPRLSAIKPSEFKTKVTLARMLSLFEEAGLGNLATALRELCNQKMLQRFKPEKDEWTVIDEDGKHEINGHASDSRITIRAKLLPIIEAAVLGHELLDWFNVMDEKGEHLGPAFEEALMKALDQDSPAPLLSFATYLKDLDINTRQANLLAKASKTETRHYTASTDDDPLKWQKTLDRLIREKSASTEEILARFDQDKPGTVYILKDIPDEESLDRLTQRVEIDIYGLEHKGELVLLMAKDAAAELAEALMEFCLFAVHSHPVKKHVLPWAWHTGMGMGDEKVQVRRLLRAGKWYIQCQSPGSEMCNEPKLVVWKKDHTVQLEQIATSAGDRAEIWAVFMDNFREYIYALLEDPNVERLAVTLPFVRTLKFVRGATLQDVVVEAKARMKKANRDAVPYEGPRKKIDRKGLIEWLSRYTQEDQLPVFVDAPDHLRVITSGYHYALRDGLEIRHLASDLAKWKIEQMVFNISDYPQPLRAKVINELLFGLMMWRDLGQRNLSVPGVKIEVSRLPSGRLRLDISSTKKNPGELKFDWEELRLINEARKLSSKIKLSKTREGKLLEEVYKIIDNHGYQARSMRKFIKHKDLIALTIEKVKKLDIRRRKELERGFYCVDRKGPTWGVHISSELFNRIKKNKATQTLAALLLRAAAEIAVIEELLDIEEKQEIEDLDNKALRLAYAIAHSVERGMVQFHHQLDGYLVDLQFEDERYTEHIEDLMMKEDFERALPEMNSGLVIGITEPGKGKGLRATAIRTADGKEVDCTEFLEALGKHARPFKNKTICIEEGTNINELVKYFKNVDRLLQTDPYLLWCYLNGVEVKEDSRPGYLVIDIAALPENADISKLVLKGRKLVFAFEPSQENEDILTEILKRINMEPLIVRSKDADEIRNEISRLSTKMLTAEDLFFIVSRESHFSNLDKFPHIVWSREELREMILGMIGGIARPRSETLRIYNELKASENIKLAS